MACVAKRWLGFGLLVIGASGCAALMGVDEPLLGDPRDGGARADGSAETNGAANDAAAVADADPPPCTTNPDSCIAVGSYCADGHCTPGCKSDGECQQLSSAAPLCNLTRHQCVTCIDDNQCTGGKRCSPAGACVDTCTLDGGAPCVTGELCCGGLCIDPKTDVLNCGKCDSACSTLNGAPKCDMGHCQWKCAEGFGHCATGNTGCETDTAHDVNNCGTCKHVCSGFGATEVCAAGKCDVVACAPFIGDCNNKPEDGCECACGGASLPGPASHCCPGKVCYDGQCGADNVCRN